VVWPAPAPGKLLIDVHDDAPGIAGEAQAHLFEPFFTTKGVGKGTGLGLAAVFGIVETSDGFLSVSTTPGAGTEVHVFLPAIAASAKVSPESAAPERSPPGGHETLLLVEDEDGVRRLGERILTGHGYRVLTASSGQGALDLLASNVGAIDLLITDEVMPGMSGHILAETVRRQAPHCSVLFVSGYSAPEAHESWHDNGESAFLQKPFTPLVLARKVRELLDGGPMRSRGS